MTLFRYSYTWVASCLTLLVLCVTAINTQGLRSSLASQAEQQLHTHAAYFEHWLSPTPQLISPEQLPSQSSTEPAAGPDYQAVLDQLQQFTPLVEAKVRILAIDAFYASTPLSTPEHHTSRWQHLQAFDSLWPSRAIERTLISTSQQTIIYNAAVSKTATSRAWMMQVLPLSFWSLAIYLTLLLILYIAFRHKLLPLSQLALSSASSKTPLPGIKATSIEAQAWVNMQGHFNKKMDEIFRLQALEANKLKAQAYEDNVSGLGNRHYFINQLNAWLDNPQQAGLILLKSTLIDEVYQQTDFTKGDSFTRQLAEDLNSNIVHAQVYLARLSYDEFAVLLPNISTQKITQVAEEMQRVHQQLEKTYRNEISDTVFLGLLLVEQASSASHVLGQLDNILAQACRNPTEPIQLAANQHQVPSFGKLQWKSLLLEAIDTNAMNYKYQPVIDEHQKQYHLEVFTSLKAKQSSYQANQFLGAIEDVGAGALLDKHVIAHHINILNADADRGPYAINLTTNSIIDPSFNRWLDQALARNQQLAGRLHFEIPESCFIRTPDACSLLCSAIRFYKFQYGVDGFGRYFKSLTYLDEFRPDFAKIDFSYTRQLNDEMKQQLLSSICRTAHSLNIMTIATRVETETQLERLSDLFVSGFQGFYTEQKHRDKNKASVNSVSLH